MLVGSFTHKKESLEYFYIKDPKGIKEKLEIFYTSKYPKYEFYINVKEDKKWSYYTEFLYPNEDVKNYMGDQSVIRNLEEAGDPLTKKRKVEHWLYFSNQKDLKSSEEQLSKMGFAVQFSGVNNESSFPYVLQVSREDKVDIDSIYPITSKLREIAKANNGEYDGWGTTVEKE